MLEIIMREYLLVYTRVMGKPLQKKTKIKTGRSVSYFDFGDPNGYPILLHTGHISSGVLAAFIDKLALENQFRVISINRPGIGESDFYDYDLNSVANDSRELMKVLGFEKYILVGLSAGVAYLFALSQKNESVSLAVALGSFGPYKNIKNELVGLEKLYFMPKNQTFPKFLLSFFRWTPWAIDLMANFFLDGLPEMEQKDKMKEVLSWDRNLAFENGLKPMLQERNLLIKDWADLVKNSNQKIKYLFFHGEFDKSASKSVLDWYSQTLKNSAIIIYKNENHFAPLNHLQEIFSEMRKEVSKFHK